MAKAPEVRLLAAFPRPLDTAVAALRTRTSPAGPVSPEAILGGPEVSTQARAAARERRNAVARTLRTTGHRAFEHAHFLFSIAGVSRQVVWSFLHAHPFSSSEQVAQRFVKVEPDNVHIPELPALAHVTYLETVALQHAAYRKLAEILAPAAREVLLQRFPTWRRHPTRLQRETARRSREVARAVLPVATLTSLLHTVSCQTLLRYWRLCQQYDVPREACATAAAMVAAVLAHDPDLRRVLEEPIPLDETPEAGLFAAFREMGCRPNAFRREFDERLGGLTSKLLGKAGDNVELVAAAVRAVFGLGRDRLGDEDAVRLALDPASNRLHGEDFDLDTLSKFGRCLCHAHYTFAKKLSHAADCEDQRYRTTPAAGPLLAAVVDDGPDVVVPRLIRHAGGDALRVFEEAIARAWEGAAAVRRAGASAEDAHYLLPNALAVRFVESSDLLNLHQKHRALLCYNAHEEIWQASVDEARQILQREPAIGRWLLPPCGVRQLAGRTPYCPERDRYCGVPVWRLEPADYARLI
jgi:thymidylate synthase ThyX